MDNGNNSLDGNLQRPDDSLGAPANIGPATGSGFGHRKISPFGFDRLAFAITTVAVLVVLAISGLAYFLVNSSSKKPTDDTPKADKYSVSSLSTKDVQAGDQLKVGNVDHLAINGQLQVSKTLVITPTSAPSAPTLGQIYFDKKTNTPYYYDGTQFVSLKSTPTSIQGITGSVNVGGGISLVNSTLVNSGVISIQGQTGAVSFAGGSGIAINGSTITNTGVLGIQGNPNQLAITSGTDGNVQVQIIGIQDGGVLIGSTGGGIDSVLPTMGGQCLISDPVTQKPVFGSCSGNAAVTGITVGSTTLTNNVVLQGAGGIAVTQSGQTITVDGSSITSGGDVKFGTTHTSGHITMLDNNGDLVDSSVTDLGSGLKVQGSNYYVDLANSGASTLTIKNSTGSNVADLTVTGVVQANGGIKDSNGNLYSFATTPTGTSRTLCYVDNLSASNCPTGGNVSRSGTTNNNRIAKFDSSGNVQNSALTETGSSLQIAGAAYSIDLQNAGSDSTLSILNSDGTRVANLSVEGSISTTTGFLQGTDLYTLPTNGGQGGVLCYVKSGVTNCPTGGNVSYGTKTNGFVAYVDNSGTLSTTDLAFSAGQLQATAASYTLDFKNNSGASTLNVNNSGTGAVANLVVSGSVRANGGLVAHTLTDSIGGGNFQITSSNNNIVFSINGGTDTFLFPTGGGTGQTICTSGISCASGGGQAVILEPGTGSGTAQTSSANRPSIWIDRTGGSGNILQLQAGGNDALVVDSTGAANIPLASGLALGKAGSTNGKLTFGRSGASGGTIALQAAAGTSSYTLTLPTSGPTESQCLMTDGSGNLSFATCLSGGSAGSGVTEITDGDGTGSGNAFGSIAFTSADSSISFTVTSHGVDFSVPAGATGVTSIGNIDTQTKSANGAVISGTSLYLQTADASAPGLVSTGAQTFAGAKTFANNITVQGGTITAGVSGSQAGSLVLATSGAGNVSISSASQAANRALTIPTITADDEICLKTKQNCASTGSNFIVNGTGQQTSANFNIQSVAGQVAAKIQGASGQDIVDFYGSASSTTPLAKIDASGNFTAVNGTFTGPLSATTGTFSSALSAVGVNSGSGLIQGTGGLTVAGTITLSSLNTAGVLHTNGTGVVSTGDVALGTETSGNYVGSLGTLTGLTTSGNSGEGSTPTLSVTYGSLANTAVQGNTSLTCASGTGNLTGGGTNITLGTGGSCGTINLVASPAITGTLAVQGSSVTVGNGATQGKLVLVSATSGSNVTIQSDNQAAARLLTIPTITADDEICLKTKGNCFGSGTGGVTASGGAANYVARFTAGTVLGKGVLLDNGTNAYVNNASATGGGLFNVGAANEFQVSSAGAVTATGATLSGGLSATTGTFSSSLSAVGVNSGSGLIQGTGGLTVTGATSINTTGSAATTIGSTAAGNLSLQSSSSISLDGAASATYAIGASAVAGTITIGGSAQTGTITVGQSTATNTVNIGNGTITTGNTGTINIGTSATGTGKTAIAIGSTNGASSLSLQAGTGGVSLGSSGVANTIQIGNTTGAVAQTVNVGNNATASSSTTLNLGSAIGASTTNIQGGSGGVNVTSGTLTLGVAGTTASSLILNNATNTNTITLQANTTSSSYTLKLPTVLGTANQCLTAGGSGTENQLQFQACTSGSFQNGGNNFGALAQLGTNDNFNLNFRTNGTDKLVLDTSGNLQFLQASTINVASAATGSALTIKGGNATSGTNVGGNLVLQGGAGASTGASGSVIVKSNTNNSTTAFQVQNASGVNLLNGDTSNQTLTVGTAGSIGASAVFAAKSDISTATNNPYDVAVGDFNRDGYPDAVVSNYSLSNTTASVFLGSSTGLPSTASQTLTTSAGPRGVVAADFNGDGYTDAAVSGIAGVTTGIYLGSGSGLSTSANYTLSTAGSELTTGDFNNDGKPDLLIASTGSNQSWLYLNTGTALSTTVSTTLTTAGAVVQMPATGDFNGDGKTDLALASTTGIHIFTNNGSGLPTTPSYTLASGTTYGGIATGDFNNDGKTDVAAVTSNNISIFLNSGTVVTTPAASTLTGSTAPFGLVAGDFNGDGKTDLAAPESGGTAVRLYINSGSALPTTVTTSLTSGASPHGMASADFNKDGKIDLITANSGAQTASVFLGTFGGLVINGQTAAGSIFAQGGLTVQGVSLFQNSLLVRNSLDSASALAIQNANGLNLLNADTANMRISVGSRGTTTGQLYVSGNTPSGALGSANGSASSYGLAVQGRYAYTSPGNGTNGTNGFQVYDVSNPASPVLISSANTTAVGNKRVKVQGKYAYVTGWLSSTTATFQVFDISNPKSPSSVGSVSYTVGGNNTPALYVQGRYAYVGDSGTPTLYAFDISNPASPSLAGSVAVATTSNGPADMYVQGRYAYIVNGGTARFQIIDVSNPASMSLVNSGTQFTSSNITQTPTSVAVQSRYAYVGTATGGSTYVIDVSDPSIPTPSSAIVASVTQGGPASSLVAQGRYLYESDSTNGVIRTIDISTPTSPSMLSDTTTATSPLVLVADGRYIYSATNAGGTPTLQTFDFGGAYTQQLEAGGIETDTLNTRGNASFSSDVNIQGGVGIGGGLQVSGNAGFQGSVLANNSNSAALQAKSSSALTMNANNYLGQFGAGQAFYTTGTISQSGTTVTGSGTSFVNNMLNGTIFYPDGTSAVISSVNSSTSLTVGVSKTVSAGSTYMIAYGGLSVNGSGGLVSVQSTTTNSTTAFQVLNTSGSSILNVDTSSQAVTLNTSVANTTGLRVVATAVTTGSGLSVIASGGTLTSGNLAVISHSGSYSGTSTISGNDLSVSRNITSGSSIAQDGTTVLANDASTANITIGDHGDNKRLLVVMTGCSRSITYNGVALTAVTSSSGNNGLCFYYLKNPPTGSSYQVAGMSGLAVVSIISSWYNVDQTTPISSSDFYTQAGSGGTASVNVTSVVSSDVVLDSEASTTSGVVVPGAGQTALAGTSSATSGFSPTSAYAATYKTNQTGTVAMSASGNGVVGSVNEHAVVLHAATGASVTTTGAVASFSNNCTASTGTCTDSSNVLNLNQQFSSATGAVLNIQNAGSGPSIQSGVASGSNTAGGALTLAGGQGTGTGAGGGINLQIAKPGTAGSSVNSLSTVMSLSGTDGSALFKNAANSTTAFQIQNTSNVSLFTADTTNNLVAIGGNLNVSGNVTISGTLAVTGAATFSSTLAVTGAATFSSNITVNGHIIGGGSVPTALESANAGTGASCNITNAGGVTSTDTAGRIRLVTGSGTLPAISPYCTITFNTAYGSTPHVVITPLMSTSALVNAYVTPSTTNFVLNFRNAASNGVTYDFDYIVVQ